ncbi:MAG: hypothetical protein AAF934_00065 [Bacteroidota bacterium]
MTKPIISIKFLADLAQFSSQMQNASRQLDKTGKKMQRIGTVLSAGLSTPLIGIGFAAVNTAADLEKLNTSLKTVFKGNEKAAKKAYDEINDFASKTPFQVDQVANAFIKLKNLGLDASISSLKSYGNTASALGKDLDQLIEAVADAATFEFERLKEFGIKAKQQKDTVSFTFQGVTTTVEKNATAIQNYLLDIGNTEFAGAIEAQSNTFLGKLSTFRDNVKQVSADFGEIIIEFINPLIEDISELTQEFKELSPETKKFIVIMAGFAAAVGPAVVVTGTLIRNVNTLIPLMKKLRKAIAANPYTAAALAVAAVSAALIAYGRSASKSALIAKNLNDVNKEAARIVAGERAELDSLLKVARDENRSKSDRESAIKRINAIAPEYLGFLTLENINTQEATTATENYIAVLNRKAKTQAAVAKKEELFAKRLEKETEVLSASSGVFQDLSDSFFSLFGVETQKFQGIEDLNKKLDESVNKGELSQKAADLLRQSYGPLIEQRKKDIALIDEQINALDLYIGTNTEVADTNNEIYDTLKKIATITKKSELAIFLTSENEQIRKAAEDRLKLLKNLLGGSKKREQQQKVDITISAGITDFDVEGIDEVIKTAAEQIPVYAERLSQEQQRMLEDALTFNEGFTAIWQDTKQQFLENLGVMIAGLATGNVGIGDLAALMLGALADLAIRMGKLAIQIGTTAEALQKTLANPFGGGIGAIIAGVALIALGTLVKGAAANIAKVGSSGDGRVPALASGGIAMGPTLALVGEYAGARGNPEVIAPLNKLQDLIRPAQSNDTLKLTGELKASGQDLLLVIDRAEKKRNRNT